MISDLWVVSRWKGNVCQELAHLQLFVMIIPCPSIRIEIAEVEKASDYRGY